MPIGAYFKGHGTEVMSSMKKKYGPKAEQVFYATANKMDMKPKEPKAPAAKGFKAGLEKAKGEKKHKK